MDLWNVKNLQPPPIITSKTAAKEFDVKFLNSILKEGFVFFENQKHLYTEAALLSRTIYRMKMKFRSSKDFKALEKLGRALKIYLHIQISKVLKSLLDSMPQNWNPKAFYLPTKHMLDFVLVRLQSLGKLLIRVLESCKIISDLAQQRLRLGHFWQLAILYYGMSARIFVITKELTKYTCELYSNLLPFSLKLNNVGQQWLPDGYVFPKNLNEWLNIDWIDLEPTIIEIPDDASDFSYFNLIDDSDDDIEFCDEYIVVKDDEFSMFKTPNITKNESIIDITDQEATISDVNDNVEVLEDVQEPSDKTEIIENINTPNNNLALDDFIGFNDNIDIGEVVNRNEVTTSTTKKRKCKKHPTKTEIINLDESTVINLSNFETPQAANDDSVIEVIDTPQTSPKKKRKNKNLQNIETPKPKKRKFETAKNNNLNLTDCSVVVVDDIKTPIKSHTKLRKSKSRVLKTLDVKNYIPGEMQGTSHHYTNKKTKIRPKKKKSTPGQSVPFNTQKRDSSVIILDDVKTPRKKTRSVTIKQRNRQEVLNCLSKKQGTHNLQNTSKSKKKKKKKKIDNGSFGGDKIHVANTWNTNTKQNGFQVKNVKKRNRKKNKSRM